MDIRKFRINQPVVTPIGEGMYQGIMSDHDRGSLDGTDLTVLVRVKLTDESMPHLHDANCLTPRASSKGLWTFKESELR